MHEFINKSRWNTKEAKPDFTPTSDILETVVRSLIRTSNFKPEFDTRLLELARQKPSSEVKFEVVTPDKTTGLFEISANDNGVLTPIFRIGFGTTSIFYVNKFSQQDHMVYKSKLTNTIASLRDLLKTVEDFIMVEPVDTEVVDISREALTKKMNERKQGPTTDFSSFKNFIK